MSTEQIGIDLVARDMASAELGRAGAAITDLGGSQERAARSSGILQGAVMGVGLAVGSMATNFVLDAPRQAIEMLGNAVGLASDKAEAATKAQVLFGDSTDIVMEASRGAAETVGMSSGAYITASGNLGNLFNTMGVGQQASAEMSTNLVNLSADVASFNNASGGSAEVAQAMASALIGETEPMRRFGVMVDVASVSAKAMEMGLIGVGGELTKEARAQATYQLILEQTTAAQGDYARTADGMANSQRTNAARTEEAMTRLGEVIMPIWQTVQRFFAEVTVGLVDAFTGIATAVGSVLGPALAAIGPLFANVGDAADGMGDVVGGVFDALGPIIDGAVALFEGWLDGVMAAWSGVGDALGMVMPVIAGLVGRIGDVFATLAPLIGSVMERIGPILATVGGILGDLARSAGELFVAVSPVLGILIDLGGQVLGAVISAFGTLLDIVGPVVDLVAGLATHTGLLVGVLVPVGVVIAGTVVPAIIAMTAGFLASIPAAIAAGVAWLAAMAPVILAAAPFIALGAIIAGLFIAFETNFLGIRDIVNQVIGIIVPAIESVGSIIGSVIGGIEDVVNGVIHGIGTLISAFIEPIRALVDIAAQLDPTGAMAGVRDQIDALQDSLESWGTTADSAAGSAADLAGQTASLAGETDSLTETMLVADAAARSAAAADDIAAQATSRAALAAGRAAVEIEATGGFGFRDAAIQAADAAGTATRTAATLPGDLSRPLTAGAPLVDAGMATLLDGLGSESRSQVELALRTTGNLPPEVSQALRAGEGQVSGAMETALSGMDPAAAAAVADVLRTTGRSPGQIAESLRSGRDAVSSAADALKEAFKNAIDPMTEIAQLEADLSGQRMTRGLAAADPLVRAQAQAWKSSIEDRLFALRNGVDEYALDTGMNYSDALASKKGAVTTAASTAVSGVQPEFLDVVSTSRTWGYNTAHNYGEGLDAATGYVQGRVNSIMSTVRGMRAESPPAHPLIHDIGLWGQRTIEEYAFGLMGGVPKVIEGVSRVAGAVGGLGSVRGPGALDMSVLARGSGLGSGGLLPPSALSLPGRTGGEPSFTRGGDVHIHFGKDSVRSDDDIREISRRLGEEMRLRYPSGAPGAQLGVVIG